MKKIVTIFKNLLDTGSGFNRDVLYVLDRVRTGKSKDIVEQIRKLPKEKSSELKKALPSVCFSGTFKHRSKAGLVKHSGLMICDIDGFDSFEQAVEERNIASQDKYTFAAWVSPSGKGIKILIKIPAEHENHKAFFDSFAEYLNHPNWDNSGSDYSRTCFESYDPDVYINQDSDIWLEKATPDLEDIGTDKPIIALTSENRIISNLLEWWKKKYGHTKGSRNSNLYKLAIAFNDFGISKSEAEFELLKFQESDFPESEIRNTINSAYKNTGNFGSKFFEDKDSQQKIEKQIRNGKKAKEISRLFPDLDNEDVEKFISSVKDSLNISEWWHYDDNNKIKLSIHTFKFWLEQNNFFKFFPSKESDTYIFIKREQNLLEETGEKRIKDFTLEYILNKPSVGFQPYDFMAANNHYFRPDFLSMISTANVNIKEDDKDTCYLYYKNCVLEITKDKVKEIDYIDLDGSVWKNQVINREYKKFDHHDAVYRKFIWLISGQNVERYNSFKSVIGYLMHSFKTSANNKAIIFNDETISENPNGGSGKGLFWNALKYMKNVSRIDGKTFSFEKSFLFQTVNTDTQILVFDDVKKNFNFESLFSVITEGLTIEYKGQDAIQIPVEKSPKILITTNYTIGGVGGSFERRKFEIEMSGYFSYKHTPLDEFGHMLFTDWDDEEWLRFDNYMINCEQYYLANGLVSYQFNNLETRKFIGQTSSDFYEWTKDGILKKNEQLNKSIYYDEFVNDYPDNKKWLTQKRFSAWLELYGKFKGLEVLSGRTSSIRWIMYKDIDSPNNEPSFDNIPDDNEPAPF